MSAVELPVPLTVDTPCREYQGPKNAKGYGWRWINGRKWTIHRWVSVQVDGPLAPGEIVMHKCDNPPCFLYEHLQRGTDMDNKRDSMAKGRHRFTAHPGEANGQAVLTAEQVLEIRARHVAGTKGRRSGNTKDLAAEYGVSPQTIRLIVWRKTWRHL